MEWRKTSASTCSSCWPALVQRKPLGWKLHPFREWNEVGCGFPMLWVMGIIMMTCCCQFDRSAFWWYIVGYCKCHDRYEDDWLILYHVYRIDTYISFPNNVRNMDLIAWPCSRFNQILLDEHACHIRNDVTEGFLPAELFRLYFEPVAPTFQHLKYGKFQDNFCKNELLPEIPSHLFPLVFAPWERRNAAPHRSRLNDSNHKNIPSKKSSSSSQAASGQDLETMTQWNHGSSNFWHMQF